MFSDLSLNSANMKNLQFQIFVAKYSSCNYKCHDNSWNEFNSGKSVSRFGTAAAGQCKKTFTV